MLVYTVSMPGGTKDREFEVRRWRRRWANAWNRLLTIECCESRADLRRAIAVVLTDEPRPGAPAKFTPEQAPVTPTWISAGPHQPPRRPQKTPAEHRSDLIPVAQRDDYLSGGGLRFAGMNPGTLAGEMVW
jgi:hypothetical protein